MPLPPSSRLYVLAAIAGLLILAAPPAAMGRELQYPTKSPFFAFQLPDGWSVEKKGGAYDMLDCGANDDSNLSVQVFTFLNEDIGDEYKKFVPYALETDKVRHVVIEKFDGQTLKHGPAIKFVRSSFESSGALYTSLVVFLRMAPGQTCVIHCFLPKESVYAHKGKIDALLDSIRLLD